jgi:hypothetical protein
LDLTAILFAARPPSRSLRRPNSVSAIYASTAFCPTPDGLRPSRRPQQRQRGCRGSTCARYPASQTTRLDTLHKPCRRGTELRWSSKDENCVRSGPRECFLPERHSKRQGRSAERCCGNGQSAADAFGTVLAARGSRNAGKLQIVREATSRRLIASIDSLRRRLLSHVVSVRSKHGDLGRHALVFTAGLLVEVVRYQNVHCREFPIAPASAISKLAS